MVRHLSLAALIVVAACSGPKLPPPNSAEAYYDARQQAVHVAMSSLAPPQSATLVSASGFHYQAPALSLLSGPHVAYNPPPTIGLGIGGFGFGSSGVGFGSGARVGIPVGKPTVAEVSDQYIASAIPCAAHSRDKASTRGEWVGWLGCHRATTVAVDAT
jgi:hypothetical protein